MSNPSQSDGFEFLILYSQKKTLLGFGFIDIEVVHTNLSIKFSPKKGVTFPPPLGGERFI